MFNRIIVPTDGSDAAWRAVLFADRFASQCDAQLELLHVVVDPADSMRIKRLLEYRLETEPIVSMSPFVTLQPRQHTTAETIASHFESINGAALVMSSQGHGRTAAMLGNIATDVLVESFGPVVMVGPDAKTNPPVGGEFVVAVDGSAPSESVLGLAGAWAIGLRSRPWVVSVADGTSAGADLFDSAYPSRLAHHLETMTGQPAEFEILHSRHPAVAIADFAQSIDAELIFAGTHGRTGLARLAHGSVAAALVRHARCPVVLTRPASMPLPSREAAMHKQGSMS